MLYLAVAEARKSKVIAVDCGRSSDGRHASRHELQNGHLSSGILASNTVGAQSQVGLAALNFLAMRVIKVRVQDFLGVGERAIQATAHNVQVLGHLPITVASMLVTRPLTLASKNT